MRNIKLSVEYDGTRYAGWQQQKGQVTVQETLKKAIERVVCERIVLYGAGRTDAGAHAKGQVANFKTTSSIPSTRLPFAINAYLPPDIVIKSAHDVDERFHARYSARWKVYQYTVYNDKLRPAINRDFCYTFGFPLNLCDMRNGANWLIGEHDFGAFQIDVIPGKNSVRILRQLEITSNEIYVYLLFEGNGFLHCMVRRMVGTLLEVGRGKITVERVKEILESKDHRLAGPTVPAKGLCLIDVKY